MKWPTLLRGACLSALALVGACSDEIRPPTAPGLARPTASATGAGGGELGTRSLARFTVDLAVDGALRRNGAFQVRAVARGLVATRDVEVEIMLPEVAAARLAEWRPAAPPAGRRLAPEGAWRSPLAAGQEVRHQVTLSVPQPGYYRVLAVVHQRSDESPVMPEGVYADVAVRELWVWVGETDGRVTPAFDRRLFPAGVHVRPGPLTGRRERTLRPSDARAGAEGGAATLSSGSGIELVARYYDLNTRLYTGVPKALVTVYYYDDFGGYVGGSFGLTTDATGTTYLPCQAGASAYDAYIELRSDAVGLVQSAANASTVSGYMSGEYCGGAAFAYLPDKDAHVFRNLNRAYDVAATFFGRARPFIQYRMDASIPYSTYCPTSGFAYCANSADGLLMATTSTGTYGEQIWGQYGTFVMAHEYGHAYHEKALGGFVRYWLPCATQIHTLQDRAGSLECALPEGFANYFSVVTRGADAPTWVNYFETNYHYQTFIVPTYGGSEGPRHEGAIAAFLYDLTDPGNEAWDAIYQGGSYVAEVVARCQVDQGGARIYNTGVDHLVYCFEQQVDQGVVNNYFVTRSPKPTAQYTPFATPNRPGIRTLWLRDLYNQ